MSGEPCSSQGRLAWGRGAEHAGGSWGRGPGRCGYGGAGMGYAIRFRLVPRRSTDAAWKEMCSRRNVFGPATPYRCGARGTRGGGECPRGAEMRRSRAPYTPACVTAEVGASTAARKHASAT